MSSPPMTGQLPDSPSHRRLAARRETQRSRKGCPACRRRKIKCDEQKPKCGQCVRSGRSCRIIDSLFRPHAYSFLTGSSPRSHDTRPRSRSPDSPRGTPDVAWAAGSPQPGNAHSHVRLEVTNRFAVDLGGLHAPDTAPTSPTSPTPTNVLALVNAFTVVAPSEGFPVDRDALPVPTEPPILTTEPSPRQSHSDHGPRRPSHEQSRTPADPCLSQEDAIADSYQDRCEIAFFLRYFSEEPGRWMDLGNDTQYFSRYIVSLADMSALIRYAACALAAKQLGQVKDPESSIRQTSCHRTMLKAFSNSKLDFLWYGAKYYERAIQILARQISHEDRSDCHMSPACIYQSGLTPQSVDYSVLGDQEIAAATFRLLAACILCQYEDLSVTLRAWSGHLDGIYKLLRPHLSGAVELQPSHPIPQPANVVESIFWFLAINDMMDAFVSRKRTRINTDDLSVWRKFGGLPLDDTGSLIIHYTDERHAESILSKGLVRLLCLMVNANLANVMEWNYINAELDRWHSILPSSFLSPVSWPPSQSATQTDGSQPNAIPELFTRETWFSSDTCAIAMAFYHMARMVLLINRPLELFLQQQPHQLDLLATYRSLQEGLRHHASEIVPIAHGMPSDVVRKYLLQPLYVAGRCLQDISDRKSLLAILSQIDDDLGAFTDYRKRDLCEEWGIPYEPVERNIVL
ncbi:hypothetical protein BO94DRAFT_540626 [Aspergillus sclerotioniger CBS 115572]|uniref:Zn(2)-C6 fungal-type domain-containing protein n=1 Tax=Aspergillus sclerotioniger CBS 115572 TaxID=1450535 RepID=A0A317UWV6_9EURO|nr:hypothetical protein BO94DRAFT_540626 [Aspergillus sclerotioniger CBS 115572]PWY66504.1 hypothetical protein BO94DRAFT_540626 [Aspergillus sclerotioniger CBS 115572]